MYINHYLISLLSFTGFHIVCDGLQTWQYIRNGEHKQCWLRGQILLPCRQYRYNKISALGVTHRLNWKQYIVQIHWSGYKALPRWETLDNNKKHSHYSIGHTSAIQCTFNHLHWRHLTAPLESAKIKLLKQCPKCLSAQPDFNAKQEFHRCNKCKFLRKSEKYTTKCHGILTFQIKTNEVDLKIANSLLNSIIQDGADIPHMDEQDIEEMLLNCGTFHVPYTSDFYITSIQQPHTTSPELNPEVKQHDKPSTWTENTPTNPPCPSAETTAGLPSTSSTQKRKIYTDKSTPPA